MGLPHDAPFGGTSSPPSPKGAPPPRVTKSGRTIKTPAKHKDYEMQKFHFCLSLLVYELMNTFVLHEY